jgi:two-component system chemotaxis response regulator CheB
MISVLIVDDSPTVLHYLSALVSADPEMTVIGTAVNGLDAVDQVKRLTPDVVIMDIEMPELDGIAATRKIMVESPVPIVICSTAMDHDSIEMSYRAIEAGALAAVAKPKGPGAPGAQETVKRLLRQVKLMSAVKVIRRFSSAAPQPAPQAQSTALDDSFLRDLRRCPPTLIAIGASTGGPMALMNILAKLKSDFPLPILIVQHIAQGFLVGMLNWLQGQTVLSLGIAEEGEKPLPGHVYFAPDGYHLELSTEARLRLIEGSQEYNVKPAVAPLFRSLARPEVPPVLGILLTGMGRDGALELLAMRKRGHLTIAQDAESSIVDGMPGEAANLGAARMRLAPDAIAELLNLL